VSGNTNRGLKKVRQEGNKAKSGELTTNLCHGQLGLNLTGKYVMQCKIFPLLIPSQKQVAELFIYHRLTVIA
jgi:hypothetical protein